MEKQNQNRQLNKIALFTDIHIGKSRDPFYTTTLQEYIDWFISIVQSDPTIDSIGFLGDWHEVRNSIHIDTMNLSHQLIKKLNDIELPIFFVVGNHDLYNRQTRDIHSCIFFQEFKNVTLISQPTVYDCFDGGALFAPYLFHSEYDNTLKNRKVNHLLGHFEFKDFILTGQSVKMEYGPDCTELGSYKNILSGHFHKRQRQRNVQFIGNTFPTSFADAGDTDRGAVVYTFDTATIEFHDWARAPRYIKTTLSELSSGNNSSEMLNDRTFIRCVADTAISYEEHLALKQMYSKDYGVRGITILEDKKEIKNILAETLPGVTAEEIARSTVDELVHQMLGQVKADKINNELLVNLYKSLTTTNA